MEAASVTLLAEGNGWAFDVKTALTCRGDAFVQDATEQFYALYTGMPKLPLLISTMDEAPLDLTKTLEEQGVLNDTVLRLRFGSGSNTRPKSAVAHAADAAGAPSKSKGGACPVAGCVKLCLSLSQRRRGVGGGRGAG